MDASGSLLLFKPTSAHSSLQGLQLTRTRVCDARLHLLSPCTLVSRTTETPLSISAGPRTGRTCVSFSRMEELSSTSENDQISASRLSCKVDSGAKTSSVTCRGEDAPLGQEWNSSQWKRHVLAGMAATALFTSSFLPPASAATSIYPETLYRVADAGYAVDGRYQAASQSADTSLSTLDDRQMSPVQPARYRLYRPVQNSILQRMPPVHETSTECSATPAYLNLRQMDTSATSSSYSDPNLLPTSMSAVGTVGALGGVAVEAAASVLQPAASAGLGVRLSTILAKAVQHFGGGSVAGAVGIAAVYPLDTIKVRMQSQRAVKSGQKPEYENEVDCLVQVVKSEGVGALYCGLGPQLLGVAPEKAMKLTVNELLLSILESFLPGARIWTLEIFAGGGGGFSQVVFTNPVEIVKVRLQTQPHDGTRPKSTLEVIKELGLRGLYSGSIVTIARDVPSSAVFFAAYVALKEHYPDQIFLDGCLAAIPATLLVTPLDAIKTRLQMEPTAGEELYKGPLDCARKMVQHEGVGSLFKGGIARVLRVSPQFGITLCIYDMLSK